MNSNAATLRVAVFPRASLLTDVLLVLAGTALIAASAQISVKLPFTPVPITGQTFAVVLVGAMLTGNVIIYLVGLPWLAVVLDTNLEKTLEYGLYPFVPGDMFKLYLAAAILPTAWRFVGRVRGDTRT
jgi:biotin transporter BioY